MRSVSSVVFLRLKLIKKYSSRRCKSEVPGTIARNNKRVSAPNVAICSQFELTQETYADVIGIVTAGNQLCVTIPTLSAKLYNVSPTNAQNKVTPRDSSMSRG